MSSWVATLMPLVNALTGAGLGASFYVLVKTKPYLVNRCFDPKFNASYLSTFITGVTGGVILATALKGTVGSSGGGAALTPGVLAVLGGYSAEAVETVLQRLVEVLLAAVRGDASAAAKSKAAADDSAKSATLRAFMIELDAARNDPVKYKAAQDKIDALLKK